MISIEDTRPFFLPSYTQWRDDTVAECFAFWIDSVFSPMETSRRQGQQRKQKKERFLLLLMFLCTLPYVRRLVECCCQNIINSDLRISICHVSFSFFVVQNKHWINCKNWHSQKHWNYRRCISTNGRLSAYSYPRMLTLPKSTFSPFL